MTSDDVGLSRVSFIKIPNTNAILTIRKRTNYLFLRYLPAFQGRTITLVGVRSTWLEHKSILYEFNKGKIKVEKGKTPSDVRENTRGLQQNHYRAPPSARYPVPSHGGDATGSKIIKQQKKQTKQN